ncbi:MAG TPA: phosphoribosyltransferase family protein [Candidatus Bathyarchaeia archaeon]|nr:phosphoribosyltransferase family protein [Candidatus Bathyarchaeia archaeon]
MKRVFFQNREEGAKLLADQLTWLRRRKREEIRDSPLVILAIPRGGVVTGNVIASILSAKLDILVSEKIVSPYNFNITIGAVVHDGTSYSLSKHKGEEERRYFNEQVSNTIKQIERRLERFRGNNTYDLKGKTVLLVDDGMATGATMFAATQWVRTQEPKELIVAVPVAPRAAVDILARVADRIIVVNCCPHYDNVGEYYRDFICVTDEEVEKIIKSPYEPINTC